MDAFKPKNMNIKKPSMIMKSEGSLVRAFRINDTVVKSPERRGIIVMGKNIRASVRIAICTSSIIPLNKLDF